MRLAGKLIATFIVLLMLGLTILLTLLHTQYATAILSYGINTLSPYSFNARHIGYTITEPWHLTIEQPISASSNSLCFRPNNWISGSNQPSCCIPAGILIRY